MSACVTQPRETNAHLVTSVFQLGRLVELSVVEDDAGKGQIGRKVLRRSRGQRHQRHQRHQCRTSGRERRWPPENAANLFVLVSEGTVISTLFIDGLSYSDHLRDRAWICEEDSRVEEARPRPSSPSAGCLRLQNLLDARLRRAEEAAAATAGRFISRRSV